MEAPGWMRTQSYGESRWNPSSFLHLWVLSGQCQPLALLPLGDTSLGGKDAKMQGGDPPPNPGSWTPPKRPLSLHSYELDTAPLSLVPLHSLLCLREGCCAATSEEIHGPSKSQGEVGSGSPAAGVAESRSDQGQASGYWRSLSL